MKEENRKVRRTTLASGVTSTSAHAELATHPGPEVLRKNPGAAPRMNANIPAADKLIAPQGTSSPNPAAETSPASSDLNARAPDVESRLQYCESELARFLPFQAPADWTVQKDIASYVEIHGQSDDYEYDTEVCLKDSLAKVHEVLDAAIGFFQGNRYPYPELPLWITLEQKVALFTQLLPISVDESHTLRFTLILARLLWLKSEQGRLLRRPENDRWLMPVYRLADSFMSAALELEEGLACEHADFVRE